MAVYWGIKWTKFYQNSLRFDISIVWCLGDFFPDLVYVSDISVYTAVINKVAVYQTGPSRATAGPRKTFSRGPQTFSQGPSGKKIFWIFLFKMVHSGVLYISGQQQGSPNVAGPGVAYASYPTLLTGLIPDPVTIWSVWVIDCLWTGKPSWYINNHYGQLSLPSL